MSNNYPCGLLLSACLCLLTPTVSLRAATLQATVGTVVGTVTDADGEPLSGVTVAIWQDGKMVGGTSTDSEGRFSIANPPKTAYELRVSYIGFKSQTVRSTDKGLNALRIVLTEDGQTISDVVVNGYFTKNKTSFTGSVTQLKGEELKQVSGVNLISAIAALTPGLEMVQNTTQGSNPNHVPELVLRGMSSFSSSGQDVNQPTIILDGSEITMQELYDLDMNEIESINVLKDASATALYGSKAANGVIVIVRKPIKESTLHVSYNLTGNVQFPMLGDYNVLNAADKLEYERLAGLYDAQGAISSTTGLPYQYELDALYNQRFQAIRSGLESDWLAQPARNSFSHDHSLRVYGGAANLRYELTGRYANTCGVMKDDYRRRYSLGFKLDYFLNNQLQLSNRTTYQEIKDQDSPYGSFSQYVQMNPYDRMYNDDGTVNNDLAWDLDNPLYEATLGSYQRGSTTSFSNSTDLRWDISKLWRVTGHFNITSQLGYNDRFLSPDSRVFKSETDLSKKGQLTKRETRGHSYTGNLQGAFNKTFEEGTLLSVNAGGEINYSKNRSESYQALGFFNDRLSFVSQAAGYPTSLTPYGSQGESSSLGVFVNSTFSWRNRYFVDGTWRVTGSSQFGENHRYGNFWSAGAGWNIMNEGFMSSLKKHFDVFKLRYSMGYTGKVSFSPFQAMTMYEYSNAYEYRNGIGAVPITVGDVNLKWERTMNYNVGLDLSMFGRRLNVVVDAYIRNTNDLLLQRSLAPSTGVTSATQNLGQMQNRGIEFSVDGYIIRTNDFYWKLGTSGYMNTNELTKIDQALEELNRRNAAIADSYLAPLPQYAEGESVTALKLVRSAGIDPATGREVYIKRNGELTFTYDAEDRVVIGDTNPKYSGTVSTNVYWRGFSLYALVSLRLGAWVYNTTRITRVEGSDPKYNADQRVFDQRWKQPGDIALYKNIADTSRPEQTDRFAEEENVASLSALNLGYEVPQSFCQRLHLRNLRLGLNFTDILRLSSIKIERGTDYLYSNGFEFTLSATL